MSWYTIFYLITIIDSLVDLFMSFAVILTLATAAFMIVNLVYKGELTKSYASAKETETAEYWIGFSRKVIKVVLPTAVIFMLLTTLTPTKNDAMLIIGGGAAMEFVTNNEDAKEIPDEVMHFIRQQLVVDNVEGMTKQEMKEALIQLKAEKKE